MSLDKKLILKKLKALEKRFLDLPVLTLDAPSHMLFLFFFVFSLFMTILLLGAGFGVAHTPVAKVDLPSERLVTEKNIYKLVGGFPIEKMAPLIAERDRSTAAYLIGIAKKESNWGKRVPIADDGTDCYNYWGYRGEGSRGIAMGHACFGSPEEAIGIVGGRLDTFLHEYQFNTPEEMVVWKCGWSCDGHSKKSVKKWISDVGYYYHKVDSNKLWTKPQKSATI